MLNKSMLFAAVLALSTLVAAQQQSQQEAAKDAPDSTACSAAYNSGIGTNQTTFCLSANGNIVQFSRPSSVEYIKQGIVVEGYGICDVTASQKYFDYASSDSGNWGATAVSVPNATTRKFVRNTTDGRWQLTQSIQQGKASGSRPGTVQVTMSLKNLTGVTRSIYLLRAADVDLWHVDTDATVNEFDFTWDTAYGSDTGFQAFGLALTNNTFKFGHNAFTQDTFAGPDPCSFTAHQNSGPFVGDGSIGHVYGHAIAPGSTMSVTMTYRPM